MIIGHDISIGADDDTTACSMTVGSLILTLLWLTASETEEISEEITKGILHLHTLSLSCLCNLDVHYRIDSRLSSCGQIHQSPRNGC